MKSLRKFSKTYYVKQIAACWLVCWMLLGLPLQVALANPNPDPGAHPSLDSATLGGTSVWNGTNTTTMTAPNGSIFTFNNFDIGSEQIVNVVQNADWATLAKVTEGIATGIFGTLNAPGTFVLVNPSGIVFGPASFINARNFVASTLDVASFTSDTFDFIKGDGIGKIDVMEGAQIQADELVALIGQKVLNAGTISCPGGLVMMAAGDSVFLSTAGSDVVVEVSSVTIPGDPPFDGMGDVTNEGTITTTDTDGGEIILAAGDIFSAALDKKVIFGVGRVVQNGIIHADGTGDGGVVTLTSAEETILGPESLTTANTGTTNSERDHITVHSADRVTVESGAIIEATGGYKPVEVEDALAPLYLITKNSVEIIGDTINFAGSIDTSATDITKKGKILIEADNLTIADGYMPADPLDNTLYEKWIEAQSGTGDRAGTDLELVAHSKDEAMIVIEEIDDGVITGGRGDIYLRTKYDSGGISFVGPDPENPTHAPAILETDDGGNIFMVAGSGGITTGDLETVYDRTPGEKNKANAGRIRLLTTNNGAIQTGSLKTKGAVVSEVSAIADGDLTVNGEVFVYALTTDDPTKPIGFSRLCLVSVNGDVTVDGSGITGQATIEVSSHGKEEANADIRICAGKDITLEGLKSSDSVKAFSQVSTADPGNKAIANVTIAAGGLEEDTPAGTGQISINGETNLQDLPIKVEAKASGGASLSKTPADDEDLDPDTVTVDEDDGVRFVTLEIDKDFAERQPEDPCPDCPCEDCPTPPDFPSEVFAVDDFAEEHMDTIVDETIEGFGSVLDNDLGTTDVLFWSPTAFGTLVIDEDTGDFVYTPLAGYVGTVTSTYLATDGETTDTALFTITLTNTLPGGDGWLGTTHMDTPLENVGLAAGGFTDAEDTFIVAAGPYNGSVIGSDIYGGTLTYDGDYTYTPDAALPGYVGDDADTYGAGGYLADDKFTVQLWDGQKTYTFDGGGEIATVTEVYVEGTVSVDLTNELPSADSWFGTVHMDSDDTRALAVDNFASADPDSDPVDVQTGTFSDLFGDLTYNGGGSWTYESNPTDDPGKTGFVGNDADTYGAPGYSADQQFDVELWDGQKTYTFDGGGEIATVTEVYSEGTVSVDLTDTLPTADGDLGQTLMDTVLVKPQIGIDSPLSVDDADKNGGGLLDNLTIVQDVYIGTFGGTLEFDGTQWIYTPPAGYVGPEEFVVKVWDGQYDYTFNGEISGRTEVYGEGTMMVTVGELPPPPPTPTLVPAAPLPVLEYPEIQGCPVLMQAVATELATAPETIQVLITRALASSPSIQPCDACAKLVNYAAILRDTEGTHMAAMVQIFNAVAPADVPFTEEMEMSIRTAFAEHIDDIDMPQYVTAMEYIDAFVGYVVVLDTELGSPVGDSTVFVMEKHGTAIAESDNPNIAAYVAAQLEALGG